MVPSRSGTYDRPSLPNHSIVRTAPVQLGVLLVPRIVQTLISFGRRSVVYRHGYHERGVGAPVTLQADSVVIFVEFEF